MNEHKLKLLEYISKNYDKVVKPGKNGEWIEIDLIPNSHNGVHEITEILEYCNKNNIDIFMLRSYPAVGPYQEGDGIRMGRYMYYMQKTTKEILKDLKVFNREEKINSITQNPLQT